MRALAVIALLSGLAHAQPQAPRASAWAPAAGTWSVGVFNPLRWQITDTVALEAHPLGALLAPHAGVDWLVAQGHAWALAARFGLSVPSWTLNFGLPFGLKGFIHRQYNLFLHKGAHRQDGQEAEKNDCPQLHRGDYFQKRSNLPAVNGQAHYGKCIMNQDSLRGRLCYFHN